MTPAANDLDVLKFSHSSSASLPQEFPAMHVRFQTKSASLSPPAETEEAFYVAFNWEDSKRLKAPRA